jgi:hypothetical protein
MERAMAAIMAAGGVVFNTENDWNAWWEDFYRFNVVIDNNDTFGLLVNIANTLSPIGVGTQAIRVTGNVLQNIWGAAADSIANRVAGQIDLSNHTGHVHITGERVYSEIFILELEFEGILAYVRLYENGIYRTRSYIGWARPDEIELNGILIKDNRIYAVMTQILHDGRRHYFELFIANTTNEIINQIPTTPSFDFTINELNLLNRIDELNALILELSGTLDEILIRIPDNLSDLLGQTTENVVIHHHYHEHNHNNPTPTPGTTPTPPPPPPGNESENLSLWRSVWRRITGDVFERVPPLIEGYTGFLAAVFPMLPDEFMMLFLFGFCLLIGVAVFKFITRR